MPNYSDSEIQSVVDSLVRSSIRRPYDSLGIRRTDVTFSDVQESVAGVFLMYPRSPLYTLSLVAQRVREVYGTVTTAIDEISQALTVLRRRSLPVRDLSSLANARSALFELEGLVSKTSPKDITTIPAYKRMNSNLDRFLAAAGKNIKDNGQVVQTPEQARQALPGLVISLENAVAEYLRRVELLANGLSNYNSLNLAQVVALNVISNARQMLDARLTALEALSESDRLQVLRDTVLEILSIKAVVLKFGSFPGLSSANSLSGNLLAYSDTSRPAIPAKVTETLSGGLVMVAGVDALSSTNILDVWVNGVMPPWASVVVPPAAPSASLYLPESVYARIESTAEGPYVIAAGVNDVLRFRVDDTTDYVVTLTAGSRTAAQIASDINTVLSGSGYTATTFLSPLMYDGEVISTTGNQISLPFGDFPAGSVNIGDDVIFYYGTNASTVRQVTSVTVVGGYPTDFTVNGAALLAASDNRIQVGNKYKLRIIPTNKTGNILARGKIQLKQTTTVETQTSIALGIYGEVYGQGQPTDVETVVTLVNGSNSVCTAAAVQVPAFSGSLRSSASDSSGVMFYLHRTTATWTSGTAITMTLASALPTTVVPSGLVILRGGLEPDSVGTVSSISSDRLTVTVGLPSAVSASQGDVEFPPPLILGQGMSVVVSDGPNEGKYFIDSVSLIPGQATVRPVFPTYKSGFGLPQEMTGSVGYDSFVVSSKNSTLASTVATKGPNSSGTFTSLGPNKGSTYYVKFSSGYKDILEGDALDVYLTSTATPDYQAKVVQVFSDGVFRLDTPVATDTSLSVSSNALPFVRLVTGQTLSFEQLSATLKAQLQNPSAGGTVYFRDLNRLVNVVVVNTNATAVQIGDAENKLTDLKNALLPMDTAMDGYNPSHIPQVDEMIRALSEKGVDRGVDLLLEAQFDVFFGLTQEETSYSGALQSAIRNVARNDMVIRKENRLGATQSRLRSTAESPDMEYDRSDVDSAPAIDPPVDIDMGSS